MSICSTCRVSLTKEELSHPSGLCEACWGRAVAVPYPKRLVESPRSRHLHPGDMLHSSCSDLDVYEVIGVGDSTLALRVLQPNEAIHFDADNDDTDDIDFDAHVEPGAHIVFSNVQYRIVQEEDAAFSDTWIVICAPLGGCYRCTRLFYVKHPSH